MKLAKLDSVLQRGRSSAGDLRRPGDPAPIQGKCEPDPISRSTIIHTVSHSGEQYG